MIYFESLYPIFNEKKTMERKATFTTVMFKLPADFEDYSRLVTLVIVLIEGS